MLRKPYSSLLNHTLLSSAACLVLLPATALAQQSGTVLPKITVEAAADAPSATGPVSGYVASTSSAGSKSNTPITDIPQAVSVVGRQEMDDRGVVTKVDEALRYTAGVVSEPYGVDPDTDWVYIRGFNATQTGVFLDGLNLFSYGFGGFQIDAFMLERADVLKGTASMLYGGSNPGGLVDVVRKRPDGERLRYTEAGINNFGNAFFGFDLGDKVDDAGKWSFRITGKLAGGDNYTDYSEDLRGVLMPQITYQPNADTSINLFGYVSGLDQTHVAGGFLPYVGTVVDAPFGKIDPKTFYGEPSLDEGRYHQEMAGYEAKHAFESGWSITQNARYGHSYKFEAGPYTYGYAGGTPTAPNYNLNRIGFEATSKVDTFNIDNRAEKQFNTGPLDHSTMAGLDYKYYKLDHVQACCGSTPISATNPQYGAPQTANFVYLDQVLTQQQIGVYGQDQIRFADGWLVTLNGRYDYVDIDSDAKVGSTYKKYDEAWSGRGGLAYEFDNGITPYVSTGTFFNPVIGVTASATGFSPEEGYQYEAGVKYAPTFMDALFTAAVFELTKQNAVTPLPGTFTSAQLGEVRSRGIELESKVNLNRNWKLLGAATLTDLEITEDPDATLIGKTPFIVPETAASLWVDYTVTEGQLSGVSLGGGARYQGESWADNLNTLRVPSATVFDLALRYDFDQWGASLNINNLFDREYVKGCGGADVCGYGDPRTVMLKLSRTW